MRKVQVEVRAEHLELAKAARENGERASCTCVMALALRDAGIHARCAITTFAIGDSDFAPCDNPLPPEASALVTLFDQKRDAEIAARLPLTFSVEVPCE